LHALAGLYIHIPFCRAACTYCNFHFSTGKAGRKEIIEAVAKEYRHHLHLFQTPWESIYFGGGTPSIIDQTEIGSLITHFIKNGGISNDAEITLEANPEDISERNLDQWQQAGITRLSIGIQSLNNETLSMMNRKHSSQQSVDAVQKTLQAGFGSVSIDLIYGGFHFTPQEWESTLDWAFNCGADHISAYGLTIEPKTTLQKQIARGIVPLPKDEIMVRAYEYLYHYAADQRWDFYEISNLSKPGRRAKHNSNYWLGKPYLGLGPSAHSFDGINRRWWNVSDNKKYIEQANDKRFRPTDEWLNKADLFNELLMTSLRKTEGFNKTEAEILLPGIWKKKEGDFLKWQNKKMIELNQDSIQLTLNGRLFADAITADLMI